MSLAKTASASPLVAYVVPPLHADSMDRAAVRNRHAHTPLVSAPTLQTPKALAGGLIGLAAASAAAVALRKRAHAAMGAANRRALVTKAFETELGVQAPLGLWDPASLASDGDAGDFISSLPAGEAKPRKLNTELANGRLAMMATIGMFSQDGLASSAWGDWALYEASPPKARGGDADAATAPAFDPASMPGATEPLGFWDPWGFCDDKSEATFMKYRGAELKHGRVAMLANAGFLLQPALKFKGLEVNDGAFALDYTQDSAILGIAFLTVGFFELRILPELEGAPGDFGDPFKASQGSLEDESATNLVGYNLSQAKNVELNNGRLAMLGAIGAITANFYTGLDSYGQWAAAKATAMAYIKTTQGFA